MSKRAEQEALKAYPDDMGTLKEVKYISRLAFQKGYEKALKDLALTPEDITVIKNLVGQVGSLEEVCRMFNESRL